MTATELYEIVKDHPDVWGKVLAFCDYNDASYWASRVIRGDYSIQCSDATAEVALLGLGAKWLAEKKNGIVSLDLMVILAVTNGSGLLRETYAAIAEVKRAQA